MATKTPATPATPAIPATPATSSENTTENTDSASIFDSANIVSPQPKTEGAEFPTMNDGVKRGRGRPRKDDTAKKKKSKLSAEQTISVAIANANVVVGMLDIIRAGISGGECPENIELRTATIQTWAAYLEEKGMEIPAWIQVCVVSFMYVSPALITEKAKGRLSAAWSKARAWWIARRG